MNGDKMVFKKIKLSPMKISNNDNNDINNSNQLLFNILRSNKYKFKKDNFIKLTGGFKNSDQNIAVKINKLSGKKILSRNFNIKDSFSNNNDFFPYNKVLKKNISVNSIYLRSDLPMQKKYYSDIISNEENSKNTFFDIPYKPQKIDDMKTIDDRISQLAKDLNILKNRNNSASKIYRNLNNKELFEYLRKRNPSNRINSGRFLTLEEGLKSSKSDRVIHSSKNNLSPTRLIDKLNNKGTKVFTPLSQKEKDEFLYNKIFNYFGGSKTPKIFEKSIDNKYNLCYAENEHQFQKKIKQINRINRIKGTGKEHNIGQTNVELQSSKLKKNIIFIRKIVDYAYPNILIQKIRKRTNAMKKNFQEKELNTNKNKITCSDRKIFLKKYFDNMKLCSSLNVQKID